MTQSITIDPLNRVYTTTAEHRKKEVVFDIVQASPTLMHMFNQGAYKLVGGTEVKCPVVLKESSNVRSISKYETHTSAPQDAPQEARYVGWYKLWGGMVLDKTEMSENAKAGGAQVVSLVETHETQMCISVKNDMSRQFFADNSSAAKDLNGLESHLDFDTTANQTRTVGNIPKAGAASNAYANWVNQFGQITAFGTDGLEVMEEVYMDASELGTHPDIGPCDPAVYRFYKETVAPNQRERDKKLWDQGFLNLMFNGMALVPEHQLKNTGKLFMLTTTGRRKVDDYNLSASDFEGPDALRGPMGKATGIGFQLYFLRDDFFRFTDFMTPPNADVAIRNMYCSWVLGNASQRRQGCINFSGTVQF
jgi:hypothetical protein